LLRSNKKAKEKADKIVFFIDKPTVSAVGRLSTAPLYPSVFVALKENARKGASDEEHDSVGFFGVEMPRSQAFMRRRGMAATGPRRRRRGQKAPYADESSTSVASAKSTVALGVAPVRRRFASR
jgi:hypothetical protein